MRQQITKIDVKNILQKWAQGELKASEVHEWAEARFTSWDVESEAVLQVLRELDQLDMNLRTKEDIPFFLNILEENLESAEDLENKFDEYQSSIDMTHRKKELSGDPLYARFCK